MTGRGQGGTAQSPVYYRVSVVETVPVAEAPALASLAVTTTDGTAVALTPAFSASRDLYRAAVGNAVARVTLAASAVTGATVAILDGGDAALADADSIMPGHQADLSPGENTVKVRVTGSGANAASVTYTLTLIRAPPLALTALSLTDGSGNAIALAPAFAAATRSYTARATDGAGFTTVAAAADPLAEVVVTPVDADLTAPGSQVRLHAGETTAITVTVSFGEASEEWTVGVTRPATDVCSRSDWIRDLLVASVSGVTNCADLTAAHLAGISGLEFEGSQGAGALRTGDLAGLTGLDRLSAQGTSWSTLPDGIFDDLTALTALSFQNNAVNSLPAGIFDRLTRLTDVKLLENGSLGTLPDNIFEKLTALTNLDLDSRLTSGSIQFRPTAEAGAALSVRGGARATLAGSVSGPWGENVTWSWLQTEGEAVTLTAADTPTPSFTAPLGGGTLAFSLTVTGRGTATSGDRDRFDGRDTVTVTVSDRVAPALAEASANGTSVVLTFSEALDTASVPPGGAFAVRVAGAAAALAQTAPVAISGAEVTLKLAAAAAAGNAVTVSYTAPRTARATPIRDPGGNAAPSFAGRKAKNVTGDTTAPALRPTGTPSVEGDELTLVYDEALDPLSAPPAAAFAVTVNGGAAALATLRPVSVAGDTVTLRLAQATVMGDRVTVTYTAPQGADATPVRDLAGNAAANLPAQSVANRNGAAAPPAPTALAAAVGDGRVRLTWQAPALNGGSDIIGYRVSHAAGTAVPAGTSGTDVGLAFERLVTGLANGREHVFEVQTVNGAGPGTAAQVRAMPVAAACARPNLAVRRTVWTGTLTPGAIEEGGVVTAWGFRDSSGQLVESSFDLGGQSYVIDAAYRVVAGANAGQFRFGLTAALDSAHETALQLHVCDASLAFSAATPADAAHDYSWTHMSAADWSLLATRTLRLTTGGNTEATGAPAIAGTSRVGDVLTASIGTVTDTDMLPQASAFAWQWLRVDGAAETPIEGATGTTYTPVADDVGKTLKVRLRFTDQMGGEEQRFSLATDPVEEADETAPAVASIERSMPAHSPTREESLKWRVTFSEAVENVDETDFEVSGTTGATHTVAAVSGSHAVDVTVTGGDLADLDATVTLSFAAAQDIADTSGNALADTAPTGANEVEYVLDNTVPGVVSITRYAPDVSPTDADSLVWRVTFSEAIANVDAVDFEVTGTTASLTVAPVSGADAVDVTVTGGDLTDLDGTVELSFATAKHITDVAGNALADIAPTGANETEYVLDNAAPEVESIVRRTPDVSATNADTLVWRVTFSETVENADAADFEAVGTTATLTVAPVSGVDAVDVTVTGGDLAALDATVTLSFVAVQDITDTAGIALADTVPTGANEAGYVIDNTVPSLLDPVAARIEGAILVVTFNEALDGASTPANARFTVTRTPSGGSPADAALTGAPVIADSTVTLTLAAEVALEDTVTVAYDASGAGNRLRDPAGNEAADFTEDVTNDTNNPPRVVSIVRRAPAASPTNADSLVWRVTFTEAVENADAADFAVTGTTATITVAPVTGVDAVDVTVTGGDLTDLNGTVTLAFASAQDITDDEGNALSSSAPTGTNEPAFLLDNTAPSATAASAEGLTIAVTWLEALDPASSRSGAGGFRVRIAGANGPAVTAVAVDGADATKLRLTIAERIADGTQNVTLEYAPPGTGAKIRDAVGNAADGFTGSDALDVSVTPDTTAPMVDRVRIDGATLTVTFDEPLDEGSVPAAPGGFIVTVTRSGNTVSGHTVSGVAVAGPAVTLTLAQGVLAGDAVALAYTKPSTPLKDRAVTPNEVANFTTGTSPVPAVTNGTGALELALSKATAVEGDDATVTLTVAVAGNGTSGAARVIAVAASGTPTATESGDWTLQSGTGTLETGAKSVAFPITIIDDAQARSTRDRDLRGDRRRRRDRDGDADHRRRRPGGARRRRAGQPCDRGRRGLHDQTAP